MIGTWFLAKILTSTPGKKIATRLMFFDVLNIKWTWKKNTSLYEIITSTNQKV